MEERFNDIIVRIQAYLNACKDFHYFCTSYAEHLLADAIMGDDLGETIDAIKENMFIAVGERPLPAKEYAMRTAEMTPLLKSSVGENLQQLYNMASEIENLANSMQPTRRAGNVILDTIAENMAHARTLLNIEMGKISSLTEEFKKEENKGQDEKEVDREEVKRAPVDYKDVEKTVKKYEAENSIVAESSTLDKLVNRMGV